MLRQLLPNDVIRLKVKDKDRYGRVVAQLYYHNQDLGLELVRQGGAVVYAQYNNDMSYQTAQVQAKQKRLGVWSQAGAQQAPWEWRKLNPR
jgi:endonuclease YncB( thermonuclease family)